MLFAFDNVDECCSFFASSEFSPRLATAEIEDEDEDEDDYD
jgi:hypothetical protein